MLISYTNTNFFKRSLSGYQHIGATSLKRLEDLVAMQQRHRIESVAQLERIPSNINTVQQLLVLYTKIGNDFHRQKKYEQSVAWYGKILNLKHINLRYIKYFNTNIEIPVLDYYKKNADQSAYAYLNKEISFSKTWWTNEKPTNMELLAEIAFGPEYNLSAKLYLGIGYMQLRRFVEAKQVLQIAIDKHDSVHAKMLLADIYVLQEKHREAVNYYNQCIQSNEHNISKKPLLAERNKLLKFHKDPAKTWQTSATIKQLDTYTAASIERYLATASIDELESYTCKHGLILEKILSFCAYVEGERICDFFTINEQQPADYIEKIKIEFNKGQCLGLAAAFLIACFNNDWPADAVDHKANNFNLRSFFRCIILLQLPHRRLSTKQKFEIASFIELVVHLQNNNYPAYRKYDGQHIQCPIPYNVYGEKTDIQFSHIKYLKLSSRYALTYSEHASQFKREKNDQDLAVLLSQPSPCYLFFLTSVRDLAGYEYGHATGLYKDPCSNFNYYDANLGFAKISLKNTQELEDFKQQYLAHFVKVYQLRTHPEANKPSLRGEITLKIGTVTPKI